MISINSVNNVSFQGKTKKTPRGHEYQLTHKSRNIGAGVGLLSGALVSHMAAKKIKTVKGKRMIINSLNNIMEGKGLNVFGNLVERKKTIKNGIMMTAAGIAVLGAVIGGVIGNASDKKTNKNRAIEADQKAEV